jgi:hypothetical protein
MRKTKFENPKMQAKLWAAVSRGYANAGRKYVRFRDECQSLSTIEQKTVCPSRNPSRNPGA